MSTNLHKSIAVVAPIVLCAFAFAQAPDEAKLKQLYERREWFELREAVDGRNASPLYLGAVASAFNRVDEAKRRLG